MTEGKGYIIEITKKYAIVMTNKCQFLVVKRPPGMMPGKHILFKYDFANSQKLMKYLAAACIAILLISASFFDLPLSENKIYAYVSVDVNPSVEFAVDRELKVVSSVPLDEAAVTLLKKVKVLGLPIKTAVSEMVKDYELSENPVVISVSIPDHQLRKLNITEDQALESILNTLKGVAEDPILMKVSSKDRETAAKNKISMGRFALYNMIKENNGHITLKEARTDSMSELCLEAKLDTGVALAKEKDNSQEVKNQKEKTAAKSETEKIVLTKIIEEDSVTAIEEVTEANEIETVSEDLLVEDEQEIPVPDVVIDEPEDPEIPEDQNNSKNKDKNKTSKNISNTNTAVKSKENK